jgi:5-hydroxyisourate hydrolase-like protein (transthyretin family)
VLGPEDKPVSGASVLLVGYSKPAIFPAATPRDRSDQSLGDPRDVLLASTNTGADGRFSLAADLDTSELNSLLVLVFARGFGPNAHYLKKFRQNVDASRLDATEATVRLAPVVPIHGRLLAPNGMPAAGVRVNLEMIDGTETHDALNVGHEPTDERIRAFWPKPTTTDTDGRFLLEVVPQGSHARLSFNHPDFAVDEVTVSTATDDATPPGLRASDITPVKPTFTFTLQPARPVQGRVTDKETGQPLAGLLVEMIPMSDRGGHSFYARTDADGRYRVSGHAGARWYITTVYPPADSGYLAPNNWQTEWPADTRFLQKDFALEKGRIVRGRIVDADTKRPVAGASVLYQPNPGNPRNNRDYEFRNTVTSENDGRFAITTLPGEGHVLVEAGSEYIRTKLMRGKSEHSALFPNGLVAVNVPDTGDAALVEIAIRKGVTFTARIVGPEGQPVLPFAVYCRELNGSAIRWAVPSVNYLDDHFVFPGSDPSRSYKLIFASAQHQLASVIEIQPDPRATQPTEIRLQRAARVHGRVVKPGGLPMSEGQIYPIIVLSQHKKPESLDRNEILSEEIYSNLLESSARGKYLDRPGASGDFVCNALVPGLPFYIVATSGGRAAFQYVPPLKPGEDRDLGTITLKEEKP